MIRKHLIKFTSIYMNNIVCTNMNWRAPSQNFLRLKQNQGRAKLLKSSVIIWLHEIKLFISSNQLQLDTHLHGTKEVKSMFLVASC